MSDTYLNIPDEFDTWPEGAKHLQLVKHNDLKDLRKELDALAGLEVGEYDPSTAATFTKADVAQLLMELGGPRHE